MECCYLSDPLVSPDGQKHGQREMAASVAVSASSCVACVFGESHEARERKNSKTGSASKCKSMLIVLACGESASSIRPKGESLSGKNDSYKEEALVGWVLAMIQPSSA